MSAVPMSSCVAGTKTLTNSISAAFDAIAAYSPLTGLAASTP